MRRPRFERWRLAELLRLVSAASLLALALTLFSQPIRQVVAPAVAPALRHLPLPNLFGSGAAEGFLVRVVSEPRGARVVIDGAHRGTTPFFGNVACQEGQEVRIVVEAAGSAPWTRTVPCRVGGDLTVRARLGG